MQELFDMLWVELRKVVRSKMPLWTVAAAFFLSLGVVMMIVAARNPAILQKTGLVRFIAAYAAMDWPVYLRLYSEIIGSGGFLLFVMLISWVFGREFVDGTLKDLLAVPVQRGSIIGAKFMVTIAWFVVTAALIMLAGLLGGALVQLPGGSNSALLQGIALMAVTSLITMLLVLPFALIASIGRGYLLPVALAILVIMAVNFSQNSSWWEFFPWAAPTIYAMGAGSFTPTQAAIAAVTGLAGVPGTYFWWKFTSQDR